jgi:hypothetical protein
LTLTKGLRITTSSPCFIGGFYRLPIMPDDGTTKNKQIKSSRRGGV